MDFGRVLGAKISVWRPKTLQNEVSNPIKIDIKLKLRKKTRKSRRLQAGGPSQEADPFQYRARLLHPTDARAPDTTFLDDMMLPLDTLRRMEEGLP